MACTRFIVLMWLLACVPALISAITGCSGAVRVPPTEDSPAAIVKHELQNAASTGILGSEVVSIRENLKKLQATDAAQADTLLKDLARLESLSEPAHVKAQANAMISKLDGR